MEATKIAVQYSVTVDKWLGLGSGEARTERGLTRLVRRLWTAYERDERATRGGNVCGTVRYRFLVDGEAVRPDIFGGQYCDRII